MGWEQACPTFDPNVLRITFFKKKKKKQQTNECTIGVRVDDGHSSSPVRGLCLLGILRGLGLPRKNHASLGGRFVKKK